MTLHLIKMAAGIGSIEELETRQHQLRCQSHELVHVTRFFPKRRDEILLPNGKNGSLYWVFQGHVQARQEIADFSEVQGETGFVRCGIVLKGPLISVERLRHRAFQGWRYLDPTAAPRDLAERGETYGDMPDGMRRDLEELCLI